MDIGTAFITVYYMLGALGFVGFVQRLGDK